MNIIAESLLSNDTFILSIFILIVTLWFSFVIIAHKFYYKFKEKYPVFSNDYISNSNNFSRDPEKFYFIFRRKTKMLLQNDPNLLRFRNIVVALFKISIILPILFLVFILLLGLFLK